MQTFLLHYLIKGDLCHFPQTVKSGHAQLDTCLKLLESLVKGQDSLTKEVQEVKQVQAQTNTRLDTQDKKLDSLATAQAQTNTRLDRIEQSQAQANEILAHQSTAMKALAEGQKDIRERMATKQDLEASENRLNDKMEATVEIAKTEIQATILDQIAKLTRILHKYKVRLEHLEKHTKTTDPTQN